jgi:hypothetical protein
MPLSFGFRVGDAVRLASGRKTCSQSCAESFRENDACDFPGLLTRPMYVASNPPIARQANSWL